MYTLRKGGSYDRFKMMIESFLERQWEVHCLSITPIHIEHAFFHNHAVYFPFKTIDSFIAKLTILSTFPVWCVWVTWRNKIDLLIAFGSLYAFIQGLSKWSLKKPMVTLIRGNSTFGFKMQDSPKYFLHLNRFLEKLGLLFSDRIITNNLSAQEEILKNLGKRKKVDVRTLYNNIPPMNIREPEDISQTRGKHGLPEDAKVLVTAGILNRGKNIEILINCLSKIGITNLYLLIVGDGSTKADHRYQQDLKQLAEKMDLTKRIIFTGWLEKAHLWRIFRASDLFILPSKSEGMPNAMLEALGVDLPCIGSNIPGIRDILKYDELMFDPMNEKTSADKIQQIFLDNRFLERVRNLCHRRKNVFIFDWKERIFQTVTKGISSATVN